MKNNPNYIDLNKRGIGIEKSNQVFFLILLNYKLNLRKYLK